ncbi:disks large-associated protein 5 isoform X1 [Clupea harengus]|uniref:Disks large-associated protein 5 isoform X1 n=1 Tax=Clupea harengus TaxID=7950 RepID=A0A6P3WBK3_CLUHA|nr:disks large-associated protein 5 isoform X1 [Clupea harengus]
MESRFAFLHQRDSSVSMLRVKMSRRRSQSQKENRRKVHNLRRQLEGLPEQDASILDQSVAVFEVKVAPAKAVTTDIDNAVEERKKMLIRYKEAKELQKEKERRDKEKKGVFKCGLYQQRQPVFANTKVPGKAKNPEPVLSTRVTRSMRQPQQTPLQPLQQKTVTQKSAPKKEAVVRRPLSTRGQTRIPPPKATTVEPITRTTRPTRGAAAKPLSDAKTGNSKTKPMMKQQKAPPAGEEKELKEDTKEVLQSNEQKEEENCPVEPPPPPHPVTAPEEDPVQTEAEAESMAPSSFAPEGFVFQAPAGLSAFQPAPLSPSSSSASPSPSSEPNLEASLPTAPPPAPSSHPPSIPSLPSSIPPFSSAAPPPPPCSDAAATDCGPAAPPSVQQEEPHGVPYFRAVMVSETESLTELSQQWEPRFEEDSIPEEMRDRMRTVVGQARLLMKERFGQFRGLVDDCEFSRGEKITTCTDLQGFWEMIYFQVEDVNRKFNALKEAEGRGWTEEKKPAPAPRQKQLVKKPPTAGAGRPGAGAAGNAAAKSRIAAIKAAMKAKQQQAEAEKAAQAAASVPETTAASETPSKLQPADTMVFHGGFFKVESPMKSAGAVRRSSRLSVAPAASLLATPSRLRRSTVPVHASPLTHVTPASTPARLPKPSPACTPQPSTPSASSHGTNPTSLTLSFSPERPCPASLSRLSPQQVADAAPCSSEAAPALSPSEPPCSPPSLMVSSPSVEQHLPTVDSYTSPGGAVSIPADVDMSATPEACSEDVPGVDFERYLLTTVRTSLSPSGSIPSFSPMAVDAEMESPEVPRQDALLQTPTELPRMSPLFTPQMEQPLDSNLLLFTPELKNCVRQSVCAQDLMSFTPPTHK